jgi:hypothetical protein
MTQEREQIYRPFPGTEAETFIQWKGTDVCMDFDCPCGVHSHFDGDFAHFVQCECGKIFRLGTQVIALEVAPGDVKGITPLTTESDE